MQHGNMVSELPFELRRLLRTLRRLHPQVVPNIPYTSKYGHHPQRTVPRKRSVLSSLSAITFSSQKSDEATNVFLLHCISEWVGHRGRDILDVELKALSEEDKKKPENHIAIIVKACKPCGSHIAVAAEYRALVQGTHTVTDFCRRVRQVVNQMGIVDKKSVDILIRNVIMLSVSNPLTYSICIDEDQETLTSVRVEEICLNVWKAETQQKQLRTFTAAMCNAQSAASAATSSIALPTTHHALKPGESSGRGSSQNSQRSRPSHILNQKECNRCSSTILYSFEECLARNAKCRFCGKIGHYE